MTWFLLVLLLDPAQRFDIPTVGSVSDRSSTFAANADGLFLILNNQLHHFDLNGTLIRKVGGDNPAPKLCTGFLYYQGYYVLFDAPRQVDKKPYFASYVYDDQGRFLFQPDGFTFRVGYPADDGHIFYVPHIVHPEFGGDQAAKPSSLLVTFSPATEFYPRLLALLPLKINDTELHHGKPQRLFKATPILRETKLNYKVCWALRDRDDVLVMNELEPRVFFYPAGELDQPCDPNLPNQAETIELELPGFVTCQSGFKPKKNEYKNPGEEIVQEVRDWEKTFSQVLGFQKDGGSFYVAYRLPGDQHDGLVIRRFGADWTPKKTYKDLNGLFMGIVDGKAYTMAPSQPKDESHEASSVAIRIYDL